MVHQKVVMEDFTVNQIMSNKVKAALFLAESIKRKSLLPLNQKKSSQIKSVRNAVLKK